MCLVEVVDRAQLYEDPGPDAWTECPLGAEHQGEQESESMAEEFGGGSVPRQLEQLRRVTLPLQPPSNG